MAGPVSWGLSVTVDAVGQQKSCWKHRPEAGLHPLWTWPSLLTGASIFSISNSLVSVSSLQVLIATERHQKPKQFFFFFFPIFWKSRLKRSHTRLQSSYLVCTVNFMERGGGSRISNHTPAHLCWICHAHAGAGSTNRMFWSGEIKAWKRTQTSSAPTWHGSKSEDDSSSCIFTAVFVDGLESLLCTRGFLKSHLNGRFIQKNQRTNSGFGKKDFSCGKFLHRWNLLQISHSGHSAAQPIIDLSLILPTRHLTSMDGGMNGLVIVGRRINGLVTVGQRG